MDQPTLTTSRLILRPYALEDAAAVQRIVSKREVAATTLTIPHPYPEGGGEEWIKSILPKWAEGSAAVFAITLTPSGELIGTIDLRIKPEHRHAEMGYVIARKHWGNGYATEAASAMLRFGFRKLNLNRIFAHHMTINPASGVVMRRAGMRYEGTMRQHVVKWDKPRDIAIYGVTRVEWDAQQLLGNGKDNT
jgi:[ribosomal protein S5]-alanine N-acetyltransferase